MKLDTLFDIALSAGREIMAVYADGSCASATKGDGSPVTEADSRAERVILDALHSVAPLVAVVAEEEASAGRVPASCDAFFIVDPLDGTKEFLSRNGEFTVNIAYVESGVPQYGVVYAPALGRIYGGQAGSAVSAPVAGGALGPLQAIRVRSAPERLTAIGSRSHGSDATAGWLGSFAVDRFVSRGSSLKFCAIAAGEADVYPRLGRTMEWDTAAGDAVLRAAGGLVTTLDGASLTYNKRNQAKDVDFANPHFVAWGDRTLIARACAAAMPGPAS